MSSPLTVGVLQYAPKMAEAGPLHITSGTTFIHAPGFEDRTLAFADGFLASPDARAILLDYRPFNERNKLSAVREILIERRMSIEDDDLLVYDRFDPQSFDTDLRERLRIHRTSSVVVDVSSMSKLAIILVLKACLDLQLDVEVRYSEAKQYGPSKEEFESARANDEIHRPSLHVYSGIHGVVRADGLSSVAMQGQPTAAIVFMSFNEALTQTLLNTVYPSRLFLINGIPPVHSWRERATAWVHEQVRKEWEQDNPLKESKGRTEDLPARCASTLDYRDSFALLLDLYWALSATHRILLAPSGSKMQTLACFLTKALHPDVHIEYPSPEGFAGEYSEGIGTSWVVRLGNLPKLITKISHEERRSFLEIGL